MKYIIFLLASFSVFSADVLEINEDGFYETITQLDVTVGPDITRADLLKNQKSDICFLIALLDDFDQNIKGAQFTFLGIEGGELSFKFGKSDCH